jgi:hypothetical protein
MHKKKASESNDYWISNSFESIQQVYITDSDETSFHLQNIKKP